MKVGLRREDALCRSKWSLGDNQIAVDVKALLGTVGFCKKVHKFSTRTMR